MLSRCTDTFQVHTANIQIIFVTLLVIDFRFLFYGAIHILDWVLTRLLDKYESFVYQRIICCHLSQLNIWLGTTVNQMLAVLTEYIIKSKKRVQFIDEQVKPGEHIYYYGKETYVWFGRWKTNYSFQGKQTEWLIEKFRLRPCQLMKKQILWEGCISVDFYLISKFDNNDLTNYHSVHCLAPNDNRNLR